MSLLKLRDKDKIQNVAPQLDAPIFFWCFFGTEAQALVKEVPLGATERFTAEIGPV